MVQKRMTEKIASEKQNIQLQSPESKKINSKLANPPINTPERQKTIKNNKKSEISKISKEIIIEKQIKQSKNTLKETLEKQLTKSQKIKLCFDPRKITSIFSRSKTPTAKKPINYDFTPKICKKSDKISENVFFHKKKFFV